jgi:ATP-dependent DNA helicase PIF1
VVRFSDGVERVVGPELFSVSLGGVVVAQRSQLPLDLSWGISVHKAQGMTVDRAQLHLKNVFECGQAYGTLSALFLASLLLTVSISYCAVALSRVRSLAGLSLTHPLQASQVRAHPEVVKFYSQMHTTQRVECTRDNCTKDEFNVVKQLQK